MALTNQSYNTGGAGGCPSYAVTMPIVVGNNTVTHNLGNYGMVNKSDYVWRIVDTQTNLGYEEVYLSKIISETVNEIVFSSDIAIPSVRIVIQVVGCVDAEFTPVVPLPATLVEGPAGVYTFNNGLDAPTVITSGTTPIATSSAVGTVKPSNGLNIALDGTLTLKGEQYDQFMATASQTAFTLTAEPLNNKVRMFIDGIRIPNAGYTVSGTSVTYIPASNDGHVLTGGERIQFDYLLK
jgi:uncharacterized protein (UPF0248 family)